MALKNYDVYSVSMSVHYVDLKKTVLLCDATICIETSIPCKVKAIQANTITLEFPIRAPPTFSEYVIDWDRFNQINYIR